MEKNLSLFQSVCKHVDIITTIIEYLNNIGMQLMFDNKYEEYKKDDVILLVIFTVSEIYKGLDNTMDVFLENAILRHSVLETRYKYLRNEVISYTNEIILLADADLYAVINYFRIELPLHLNKIWIQEPIKEKFLWLMEEYFGMSNLRSDINTFRTKNELFTAGIPNKMKIVSIWTEDIVFAKNLATSLNRDVLFINTYMDFHCGVVLLPYTKIFDKTLHKWCKSNLDDCIKKSNMQKNNNIVYNLFYDGMWQQPVESTYWVHNDSQWANATSEDVNRCINSAEKGFKIWSTKPITFRVQVLSKFASILRCNGKSVLADIIATDIKFSYIYQNSLSCSQSGGLEVTKIRNPKGVIILKAKDETVLFRQLTQILTIGNSVIVICDTNSCSLAPYCNMLSASAMPSGVINLLSNEDLNKLELALCGTNYESYAEQFFSENNMEKIYINLTIPKQIILPLK
ncbi:PREDICTED: uncharacterized protein LOC105627437 [Atta cephalotes]|uniref:Aldehyde dehydrogenase domain-containing protein n=2 Tax=Atta TaxID=12956 RepID=A0A158P2V2_ATTCE|nr:PREDICTED: uncharacterized protein LOC105627437 [Atta cephalotes]XP_018044121.1 PREDICTED: uncharacterized protein LOC108684361 [Atta colombica]